jgi:hypothetical protein
VNCAFEPTAKGCRCTICGRTVKRHSGENLIAACKVPGLGDRLASMLAAVPLLHITEHRYLRLNRWLWKTITGREVLVACGCKKRIERLNAWGRWLAKWR